MKEVWIFGAGETGRMYRRYIERYTTDLVGGFIIESRDLYIHPDLQRFRILTLDEWYSLGIPQEDRWLTIAIIKRDARARLWNLLQGNVNFYTFVHPDAFIDPEASIGEGSFIFERNVIQSKVKIGQNTILWSGNHIGHGTSIGSHCFLASHVVLCGGVVIQDRVYIGVNACVAPNVQIGSGSVIGMACAVNGNIPPNTIITGGRDHVTFRSLPSQASSGMG